MSAVAAPAEPWQAWFDGAAQPNPGRIGIGAVLLGPHGERFEISRRAAHAGCNNEAEALALCAVLELALAQAVTHLVVAGDSEVVVRLVQAPLCAEAARLGPLLQTARQLATRFAHIRFHWIPQHRNPDADRLSRNALGLPARPTAKPAARRRRR